VITRNVLLCLFCLAGLTAGSAAQGSSCTATLTVGVTNGKGEPFRDLNPNDFNGGTSKVRITVKSVTYDDGPRRIALVVDQAKKLTSSGHRTEQALVQEMMADRRPQDSFALVVARGSGKVIRFGEDASGIAAAAYGEGEGSAGKDIGVLDAVMQAISLFGEPKPGDSIVVIAADTEGNHKSNPKSVAKALREHGIRMFGLALGPVSHRNAAASTQSTTAWGLATVRPATGAFNYTTGDEDFLPLTGNSGGAVLPVLQEQQARQSAKVISVLVASFYRMEVERSQGAHDVEDWKLDVSERLHNNSPQILVLYQHQLGPC